MLTKKKQARIASVSFDFNVLSSFPHNGNYNWKNALIEYKILPILHASVPDFTISNMQRVQKFTNFFPIFPFRP